MNRGSEWRIWDLHVHTPLSIENNYNCADNDEGWDKYITALEQLPSDIKVLGINDYLFIDGYKKVKEYKDSGRLANIDLILPVVEFRLSKFCGHKQFKRINFHVNFSNDVTSDIIQHQFLNALSSQYVLSPDCAQQWGGVVTRENLEDLGRRIIESVPEGQREQFGSPIREGFNNLNLDIDNILNVLKKAPQYFEGKYITAIGKTEWDDFKWDDNSIAEKKTIINTADIVFTASESVEKFNKAKAKLEEQKVNSLLLDCSDAHSFSDAQTKDRLGNCKCWIKADTTFEGLKQIMYEPEERIKIQMTKPDDKSIYQVIDSIDLSENGFRHGTIFLNPNLNTIIGGRSTGKSTLLKAIAAKHGSREVDSDDFVRKHLEGVSIKWQDGTDQIGREIDYFKQSYMHDIAFDISKTNELIEGIIRNKDTSGELQNYYKNQKETTKIISESIFALFQIQKELKEKQNELISLGKKEGVVQQVTILKSKIAELQKDSSITPEIQREFEQQVAKLKEYDLNVSQADYDLGIFKTLLVVTPFDNSLEERYRLNTLSLVLNQSEFAREYKNIKIESEAKFTELVRKYITSTKEVKEKIIKRQEEIKLSDTYKKGIAFIEGNKELKDINDKLVEEEKKLQKIQNCQSDYDALNNKKNNLIALIVQKHCSLKTMAEDVVQRLQISYDGLVINVVLNHHKDILQQFLEARLNQRGYERQDYLSRFVRNYNSDNKNYVTDILTLLLNGELQLKSGYFPQNVSTELIANSWYSLGYELSYQNDSFKQMSEGKQAFVILKLLLDFSDKKCPILIDQPEDSLDNRAIYQELVEYIKQKKIQRQIILVTHNSNVVVSADAENVIVANQEGTNSHNENGFKFQYKNGALENTSPKDETVAEILNSQGIREHVCDILEGGRAAFEKREQKYGFKK